MPVVKLSAAVSVRGELLEGMAQQKALGQANLMHFSKQRGPSSLGHSPTALLLDNNSLAVSREGIWIRKDNKRTGLGGAQQQTLGYCVLSS